MAHKLSSLFKKVVVITVGLQKPIEGDLLVKRNRVVFKEVKLIQQKALYTKIKTMKFQFQRLQFQNLIPMSMNQNMKKALIKK